MWNRRGMADDAEVKKDLHHYLQDARDALLWKVGAGASEYDVRRPLVRTGSNLLGIVKHLSGVEIGYFGDTFGRPYEGWVPQLDDDDANADMWATADESREQIIEMYRRLWAHSDATINELDLDTPGRVPWWPAERNPVTLLHILARVTAETNRHAGQADILRELVDGSAGWLVDRDNLPPGDAQWWESYRAQVEAVARRFA
jgi:hypothetical protein